MINYEQLLTGGHPNSLGNTIEVVDHVLKDKNRLKDLIDCYQSSDEVVRLRVSNALKRICKQNPSWVAPYLDHLLTNISKIDQASTKWTLSTLFVWLEGFMSAEQQVKAINIMKQNLFYNDWIVQNTTSESLAHFAQTNEPLRKWLIPELSKLESSKYKSVSRRAYKLKNSLKH